MIMKVQPQNKRMPVVEPYRLIKTARFLIMHGKNN